MPALPSWLIEHIWEQFSALLPQRHDPHPLGCHRPRIGDRMVFELLVNVLVFGSGYRRHGDRRCSATTLRRRRDEWISAGVMGRLEAAAREGYDRLIGLELSDVAVDGCLTKAPCGGEVSGPNPTDRGKLGIKRSTLVDAGGRFDAAQFRRRMAIRPSRHLGEPGRLRTGSAGTRPGRLVVGCGQGKQ